MNISLAAEPLFHIGSFPVTNTLIIAWVIILILGVATWRMSANYREKPAGAQNVFEMVVEKLLDLMTDVLGSRAAAIRFFPLVATLFIFIILSNWLEIVPGLGTIGLLKVEEGKTVIVPFLRSVSSDLNFTIALAVITVLAIQIFGIMSIGFWKYAGKFINFHGPINFFVGILELIGEISKIISLSFRLFGNIFAGEVLLTVILFLVPYIVPLPFLALEIFVGFVQALVFSMLTLVFLKIAMAEHH